VTDRLGLMLLAGCLAIALICVWFFFSSRRRHTRFSRDWSSDVCSSDLRHTAYFGGGGRAEVERQLGYLLCRDKTPRGLTQTDERSEERRVGKECRSRGAP